MALAIFDLDHTLISTDSDHQWLDFLCSKGIMDTVKTQQANDKFYQDYQAGTLNMHEYLSFALAPLTAFNFAELAVLHAEFMQTRIIPNIYKEALDIIEWHRAKGDKLLVITATNEFVVAPIVAKLGIADFLAIELERHNDKFTGNFVGELSFGAGKIKRFADWNKAHNFALADCYFYSDSINDLPLLAKVGTPVATNPCPSLRQEAAARGWQIVDFAN